MEGGHQPSAVAVIRASLKSPNLVLRGFIFQFPSTLRGIMITKKLLEQEVFSIKMESSTLIYAPLTRYFTLYDGLVTLSDVETEWLQEAMNPANVPAFIHDKGFVYDQEKIRLRLNITNNCNLRCSYCSVNAGMGAKDMPEDVARNTMRYFSDIAKRNGAKELEVVFSGGEPTLRIPLIEQVILLGETELKGSGVRLSPRLLTNGVFSIKNFTSLTALIKEVQVSWDGFLNKNLRYGLNSKIANEVWDNIGFLVSQGIQVSILIVVSAENYLHIRGIVDQIYDYGVRNIFLSLEENLGRASGRITGIDYMQLGKIYIDIWKDYRARGVDINLTGTDVHSVSPFPCSVPIPNYSVAPDGTVSACTITFNDSDELADVFKIGSVREQGIFLDNNAIDRVREFHILNIKECSKCFAKWHCRGGCIYAKHGDWFKSLPADRCKMVQNVVQEKLIAVISENERT